MKAVILAAGLGSRLAPLTDDRPKALVEVAGRSFLVRQLERLAEAGIPSRDVVVVGGYRIDRLRDELSRRGFEGEVIENDRYQPWNNFYSLLVAEPALAGHDFVQLDGDTILDPRLLPRLLAADGEALIATDTGAELDDETMKIQLAPSGKAIAIDKRLPPAACAGEAMGISRISATVAPLVFAELAKLRDEGLTHEYYEHAFHRLAIAERVEFRIVDVHDCQVIEIDDLADLKRAEQMLAGSAHVASA